MKRQPSEINREWYSAAEVGQIFGFTADTVLKGRAGFDALPRTLFGTKFHRFHRDDVEAFKRRMVERSTSLQAEREAEGRLFRLVARCRSLCSSLNPRPVATKRTFRRSTWCESNCAVGPCFSALSHSSPSSQVLADNPVAMNSRGVCEK